MSIKTREQERAGAAWQAIGKARQSYSGSDEKKFERYVQELQGLPTTILMCGLGQTIAFLLAKGKDRGDPERLIVRQLAQWALADNEKKEGDLQKELAVSTARYRYLNNEVMAYLIWLKRFSKACENGALEPDPN